MSLCAALLFAGTAAEPAAAQPITLSAEHLAGAPLCTHAARSPRATTAGESRTGHAFDATYYHLTLDLHFDPVRPAAGYLYGRTRIEGRIDAPATSTLTFDLESLARGRVDDGDSVLVGMRAEAVHAADGTPLAFLHADDLLHVELGRTYTPGERVALDVTYEGLPNPDGFGPFIFGRLNNGDPYAWSLSEPYGARAWWPSHDHPSDKADSVRVTVTVPAGIRVGAPGLLRAETSHADGTVTYDWAAHYPIAPYLVSLAAGVYDVHLQHYVRPDSLGAALGAPLDLPVVHYAYRGTNAFEGTGPLDGWRRVLDVLPVQEHWFGPYPFPEEKYGHAHVTFRGGMEHQTMSSMGNNNLGLVSHELAHQWFGDLVTMRFWPHLWLNEGFATYGELLVWEDFAHLFPAIPQYAEAGAIVFDLYYGRARGAQGTLVVEDTTSVNNLFSGSRVYAKGGIVLHMLRGIVGDDVFRRILHAYTADPALRYGTATTADFRRVAEAVSGRDLETFFRQWVTDGTGYPRYAVTWRQAPAGNGYEVAVTIRQTQTLPLSNTLVFEMPVPLAIDTPAGSERFLVWNDQREQTYTFHLDAPPTAVRFDPERWVLHNDHVEVVEVGREATPELPGATRLEAVYPVPTPGSLHVRFALAAAGPARLALHDVLGRTVRIFLDRPLSAGAHDEVFDVADLPAGTYFLRLTASGATAAHPVLHY